MGAATKAELEALVKRLQRSLERSEAKNTTLTKALDRATAKVKAIGKAVAEGSERERACFKPSLKAVFACSMGMHVALRLIKGNKTVEVASTLPLPEGEDANPIALADIGRPASRAISRREIVHISDFHGKDDWIDEGVGSEPNKSAFEPQIGLPRQHVA